MICSAVASAYLDHGQIAVPTGSGGDKSNERLLMPIDLLAPLSAKSPDRMLEPMDRISEVLFGLIMALTFTLTLGVVTAERIQVRTMLLAALGCNLAWGIIDAGVFLMARFNQRGRIAMQLRALRTPIALTRIA